MRIVSGKWGSRKIDAPEGRSTRPTLDKVREAVFSSLGGFFDGGNVLDLYAGSGAVGLEAVSRGMDHGWFVDKNRMAVACMRSNIERLNGQQQCTVLPMPARHALDVLAQQGVSFALVYMDPPYQQQENTEILHLLVEKKLLDENGIVVIEAAKEDIYEERCDSLILYKKALYGITQVLYYRQEEMK